MLLGRNRFVTLPGTDPVRWAARYGIRSYTGPCHACGAMLTTSLPFAHGSLRGLVAPPCACGNTSTPYCVVRVDGGDVLAVLGQKGR